MNFSCCKRYLWFRLGGVSLAAFIFIFLQKSDYMHRRLLGIHDKFFEYNSCPEQHDIREICDCNRSRKPINVSNIFLYSTCDYYNSASRGTNQNVVSYTFFGNTSSIYFQGVELSIQATAKAYPGWVMRLYHNLNMSDEHESNKLCRLWCTYDHFDACNVRTLPFPLCNKSDINGELWRFFVLGDPLVDKFMIRDIDSEIIDREIAAVHEWLNSNKTWHIMRDHPWHSVAILAGMWGGRNTDLNLTTKFRNDFILHGTNKRGGLDQGLLANVVWPFVNNDSIIHDSHSCKQHPNSRPFPTQLESNTSWVGHSYKWRPQYPIRLKCPIECRPKNHPDWEYC